MEGAVAFSSSTFSIDLLAERTDSGTGRPTTKQVRFVVRRRGDKAENIGVRTLLREKREDPRYEEEKKAEPETGGDSAGK